LKKIFRNLLFSRVSLIVAFVFCLLRAALADVRSFTYKEWDQKIFSTADFTMTRSGNGYSISIVSMKGATHITQNMLCDSTLVTRQWHYKSDQNTDISLCRNGDCIKVSGVFQGKPVDKKLTIDRGLWYQIIPLGLETASRDTSGRSNLWAVSLDQPAMLKAVCFRIAKISNAPLPNHPEIRCTCFRMNIQGLPCQIWTGDYFIRQSDHIFLCCQGYAFGSKKPTNSIESIIDKNTHANLTNP
jgi:hypothetical protein